MSAPEPRFADVVVYIADRADDTDLDALDSAVADRLVGLRDERSVSITVGQTVASPT